MPQVYEIEVNGQVYEAEADSPEAAAQAAQAMAYSSGRQAEAAQRSETFVEGMEKFGPGFVEGLKRIAEGFGQLGVAGVELAARGGLSAPGFPSIGQPNQAPPMQGATAEYTSRMNARRLQATGGDPDIEQLADITEGAGLMVPAVSVGRGLGLLKELPETYTAVQAMTRGARQGAVGAGLTTGADETAQDPAQVALNRLEAAFLGGTLVGAGQLVAGAGAGITNFWTRQKQRAQTVDSTLVEMQNAWKEVGPLPVSVQTGNKLVRSLEMQVQLSKAQNYFNKLFEQFAGKVDAVNRTMRGFASNPNPSSFATAHRITGAWKKERAQLQAAQSRLYGHRLSRAVSIADQDAGIFVVPFSNTGAVTSKWASETGKAQWWRKVAPGSDRMSGDLAKLDEYLTNLPSEAGRNKLDVRELMLLRRNLNDLDRPYWNAVNNSPNGPTVEQAQAHHAVGELLDAVDKDIKNFLAANDPNRPAAKALAEFIDANDQYADFKRVQKMTDESTVGQLFGFRVPDKPEQALLQLARMEPDQQRMAMNILRNQDPTAILDLRRGLANRAYEAAINAPRAASRGRVDPDVWAKEMTDEFGLIGKEIFSPVQRAEFERGLSTVRLLRDATEGFVSPGRAPEIQGTTMAAASRSAAFISRALIRIGGLGKIEDLFFTKAGIESLDTLRNTASWKTKEGAAAMAKLASIAGMTPEEADEYLGGRE